MRALIFIVALAPAAFAGNNEGFIPFITPPIQVATNSAALIPASKAATVTNGITLGQVVTNLGPAIVPAWSGTGDLRWSFSDGRTLYVQHSTDPGTILSSNAHAPHRFWFSPGLTAARTETRPNPQDEAKPRPPIVHLPGPSAVATTNVSAWALSLSTIHNSYTIGAPISASLSVSNTSSSWETYGSYFVPYESDELVPRFGDLVVSNCSTHMLIQCNPPPLPQDVPIIGGKDVNRGLDPHHVVTLHYNLSRDWLGTNDGTYEVFFEGKLSAMRPDRNLIPFKLGPLRFTVSDQKE